MAAATVAAEDLDSAMSLSAHLSQGVVPDPCECSFRNGPQQPCAAAPCADLLSWLMRADAVQAGKGEDYGSNNPVRPMETPVNGDK